jgi:hypothetical protein
MNEIEMRRRPGVAPPAANGDTLPEHRQKQVEAGLAQYQAILAERDTLQNKLHDAMVQIDAQQVKLDAIQGIINMLESTVTTHQLQRDEAVIKAATLQATIDNVFSIIAGKVYEEPTNEVS